MAQKIVVDGSNVAHIETSGDGSPKISNIQAVRSALRDRGYDPVVIDGEVELYQLGEAEAGSDGDGARATAGTSDEAGE